MGIVVRQSLKAGLGSYIGVGIGIINQMYISTKFLSVEQLSLSRLLFENSLLFSAFAHLGTPFIVDKFFSRFRDDAQGHKGILPFLLFLPFIGGVMFAMLYWLCKDIIHDYFEKQSPMILEYHFLVIPLTFFWIYISVLEAYCRNNSRTAIPNFIREVYLRAANMLLILIFGLGWINFKVMMYLVVGAYGFAVIALIFYIRKLGKWYWKMPDRTILTKATFRQMLGYGGFTLLGGIGVNLMLFIDRSMLAGERGLVQTGIFIVAAYIAGVIEIPRKAIGQISIPLISTSLVNEDYAHLRMMNQKSALNQLLVGGLFFLLIWVSIDDIFYLIPKGETYGEGKYVVLFLALVKVIDIATGLNTEIILYSKYYRYATYFIIGSAIIGVLLNIWLIPLYGFIGAAIATTITTLLYSMMKMVFVWYKFQILPFTHETLKILVMLGGLYLLSFLWPAYDHTVLTTMLMVFLRSVVIMIAFAYLILYFKVSEEINQLAAGLWNKIIQRK